jgi:hypothetical protein
MKVVPNVNSHSTEIHIFGAQLISLNFMEWGEHNIRLVPHKMIW